ncbi:MAG: TRAP transporter substrate-binding protein [Rhizobiales bacterium]|nr:TRAP transporter substrate-binding protein [Hyphomicrobiales bacterium]
MNKFNFLKSVTTIVVATTALLAISSAQAELKGWNIHVPDYPVSVGMDKFTSLMEASTGIKAKTFHNGVLGSQPDAIKQVQLGGLDFAVFSLGPMGPIVPATNVVSLPFIFKNMDHMHRVMDGSFGDKLSAAMEEKGLVGLAWYDSGARSFYNSKKPITEVADMKGLKFRVMGNPIFVEMVEALGGNATPMAFSEVFQSLKTGVIDGAENNWPSYESTSHFEVAGFYSLSQHLIIPECLCMSKITWDKLSDDEKVAVKAAARESSVLQREEWAKRALKSRKIVEAGGIKFNEIADKSAFQDAMSVVYEKAVAKSPFLQEYIDAIQSVD